MKMQFSGVYTALITPFLENGEVDYASLEALVNYNIENKINGLVPCGTTGESPTLDHREHIKVIAKVVKLCSPHTFVVSN